jgi:hypothetical protein
MGFRSWITKHFGGIPSKVSDLEWIYRVNPRSPAYLPIADTYRTVSPGSGPQYTPLHNPTVSKFKYFTRDSRRAFPQTVELNNKSLGAYIIYNNSPNEQISFNKKYIYTNSAPNLKPDENNPDFCIRGVK